MRLPSIAVETQASWFSARSSRCFCHCFVSDSCVACQIVPVQTPTAPRASAATMCAPVVIPPAATIGMSYAFASSVTSRTSENVPMRPVWPAESCPCAMIRSSPASSSRAACLARPIRPQTFTPASCISSSTKAGLPRPEAKIGICSSIMISSLARVAASPRSRVLPHGGGVFGSGIWFSSISRSMKSQWPCGICCSSSSREPST